MVAVTPSFLGEATNLSLFGQFTVVPAPGPFLPFLADRGEVLGEHEGRAALSARRTTVISRSGRATPGFAALIFGSFHLVILPRKIAG